MVTPSAIDMSPLQGLRNKKSGDLYFKCQVKNQVPVRSGDNISLDVPSSTNIKYQAQESSSNVK